MTIQQSIVMAAAIVAASLVVGAHIAETSSYQILESQGIVWRLDKGNGELRACIAGWDHVTGADPEREGACWHVRQLGN